MRDRCQFRKDTVEATFSTLTESKRKRLEQTHKFARNMWSKRQRILGLEDWMGHERS